LASIFSDFVQLVSIRNGLPPELANEVGGVIFTFGSYRLGVHGKGKREKERERESQSVSQSERDKTHHLNKT
jgi:poly(A) polymerase Pap1